MWVRISGTPLFIKLFLHYFDLLLPPSSFFFVLPIQSTLFMFLIDFVTKLNIGLVVLLFRDLDFFPFFIFIIHF